FENGQAMVAAEREIGRRLTDHPCISSLSINCLVVPEGTASSVAASDPAGAHRAPGGVTTSPSG
ncbi:MAG: hypothetical protein WBM22_11395, partial [Pseudomonas fluorescens]